MPAMLTVLSLCVVPTFAHAQLTCTNTTANEVNCIQNTLNGLISTIDKTVGTSYPLYPASKGVVATRDLVNGAFAVLVESALNNGGTPLSAAYTKAEAYVDFAFSPAGMTSDGSGDMYWNTYDTTIQDANGNEFVLEAIGPMYNRFFKGLAGNDPNTTWFNNLKPSLTSALGPVITDVNPGGTITITYTNMYLMNAVDQLLVGGIVNDTNTNGSAMLHNWLEYVQANGISEFDSPTYTGVQMEVIMEGRRYASGNDKINLHTACDYLWLDLAAKYFYGSWRLAGAFSRDYDFINGRGPIQTWMTAAGAFNGSAPPDNLGNLDQGGMNLAFLLDEITTSNGVGTNSGSSWGPFVLQSSTLALATSPGQRDVYSTWCNTSPCTGAIPYVQEQTQYVAMGCSQSFYSPQDRLFSASFTAHNGELPLVTTVLDASGWPYGLNTAPDQSGHPKPSHERENMGCVLHDQVAFLTMNFPATGLSSPDTGLWLDMLFPVKANVWWWSGSNSNPTQVQLPQSGTPNAQGIYGSQAISMGDVIILQMGGTSPTPGLIGFRPLHVDRAAKESTPTLVLETDDIGVPALAERLAIQIAGDLKSTSAEVHAVTMVAISDGSTANDRTALYNELHGATLNDNSQSGDDPWTSSVTYSDLTSTTVTLGVSRSNTDPTHSGSQLVNGTQITPYLLADGPVGGTPSDLTQAFWSDGNHTIE